MSCLNGKLNVLKKKAIQIAVLLAVIFMPFSVSYGDSSEAYLKAEKQAREIEEHLRAGGRYAEAVRKADGEDAMIGEVTAPGNNEGMPARGTVPEPLNRNSGDKDAETSGAAAKQNKNTGQGGDIMTSIIGTIGDVYLKLKEGLELGIDVSEEFDTNIYETWDIKNREDLITKVSPKLSYTLDSGILGGILYGNKGKSETDIVPEITMSLDMDIEYYMKTPKLNKTNSADSFLQPDFFIQIAPEDDLILFLRTSYSRQNISNINPLQDEKEKAKVDTRTTSYGVDYTFGPKEQTWTFSYRHDETTHDDETTNDDGGTNDNVSTLDTKTNTWNVTTNFNTGPRHLPKIFLDYDGEVSDQSNGKKTVHNLFLGLKGNMSPKITGEVKGGYGLSFGGGGEDPFGSFVTSADLTYKISERFSCGFDFEKTLKDINFFDTGEESTGEDGAAEGQDTFNVPSQLRDSMKYGVEFSYTPPFFSDNLTLTADISQRELEYSDGGKQKVREAGVSYTYTWNMNRPFSGSENDKKQPIRIGSEWDMKGSFRTRLQSPAQKRT